MSRCFPATPLGRGSSSHYRGMLRWVIKTASIPRLTSRPDARAWPWHDGADLNWGAAHSGSSSVPLPDAHDRSAGSEPVHRRHVGGWFPGEDGLAVVHGAEYVRLALNSFLVS